MAAICVTRCIQARGAGPRISALPLEKRRRVPMIMDMNGKGEAERARAANPGWTCRKCGTCCAQDIPVTLFDIQRISQRLAWSAERAFAHCVSGAVSRVSNVFVMRKSAAGPCVFLSADNTCSIYEDRPRVCGFYPCPDIARADHGRWRELYLASADYQTFWEHAIASRVTQDYVRARGTAWDEAAYEAAIREIRASVASDPGDHLCVARAPDGRPMAMKYNCASCPAHACRTDTEITLADIERLAAHLGVSLKRAWDRAVDPRPHPVYGGLLLSKPEGQCAFHANGHECGVYGARPAFCRFNPCRRKDLDQDAWLRYFFAAGAPDEQWAHFVAARITREYAAAHGTAYRTAHAKKALERIRIQIGNEIEKREFLDSIKPFRYETLPVEPL